jgi:hypothetical protein
MVARLMSRRPGHPDARLPGGAQAHNAQARTRPRSLRVHATRVGKRGRPRALQAAPSDDRAGLRAHQAQPPSGPLPTPRQSRLSLRMATDNHHPQPPKAPPPPDNTHDRLKRPSEPKPRSDNRGPPPHQRAALPRQPARHYTTASVRSERRIAPGSRLTTAVNSPEPSRRRRRFPQVQQRRRRRPTP